MATQGGLGTALTYNAQNITKLNEAQWPEIEKVLAETTGHDSSGGWAEFQATGKFTAGDFDIGLTWDKGLAGHGALLTAFNAGSVNAFTMTSPGTGITIIGTAMVGDIDEESSQEDVHKATATIVPTGNVTIT